MEEQTTKQQKSNYEIKKDHIYATGKRKTAVARVFLYNGKGEIFVNNININEYFPSEAQESIWTQPFHLVGVSHPTSKYNATIKVSGSGRSAQLDAIKHAFSKALASISEENRVLLRKAGYLTRDSRIVERKKYFLRKARKRPQYSKR